MLSITEPSFQPINIIFAFLCSSVHLSLAYSKLIFLVAFAATTQQRSRNKLAFPFEGFQLSERSIKIYSYTCENGFRDKVPREKTTKNTIAAQDLYGYMFK